MFGEIRSGFGQVVAMLAEVGRCWVEIDLQPKKLHDPCSGTLTKQRNILHYTGIDAAGCTTVCLRPWKASAAKDDQHNFSNSNYWVMRVRLSSLGLSAQEPPENHPRKTPTKNHPRRNKHGHASSEHSPDTKFAQQVA